VTTTTNGIIGTTDGLNAEAAAQVRSYIDLLDGDSRTAPDVYRWTNPLPGAALTVPVERYTSRAFHDLEVEKVWKKVWQMACRVEDILEPGEFVKYDVADISVLVVRQRDGSIKAHRNVCLHRGRTLKESDGRADSFQCPFHGITWDLDGSLKHMPCRWDFPQVDGEWPLIPVQVDTWGGFVFINLDPEAAPLADYLGTLPEHFTAWPLDRRYKQVHVGKVLRCNWKIAQEAFMESWHVVATHPQLLPGLGDTVSKYDAWGNFSRTLTPNGVPSPHLNWQPTEQEMMDALTDRNLDEDVKVVVPDGTTARRAMSDNRRRHLADEIGAEAAEQLSDAEMCDSMPYTLFPNLHPWGSYNRTLYRFRPWGNDPGLSLMECMILSPFEGDTPPRGAQLRMVEMDTSWTTVPELGLLARVFDQDDANLPFVQKGLESGSLDEVTFADYQETKIRHFHHVLDQRLA
jgi:phenylpropionate dioxygenase-like ring-hydroxylating dioxygenase large terminal subunit